ncbi:uncharacterized protein LOC126576066 isoform X2 [Anopheles aquasalis]|uniref:uncharacterized protein LOC126576066 isoform X2 n=1 Tax=Anopheles aquasalis TaxID=42839 RepID=UPI00215AEE23|nr:uncharacterized protein LOC126576066 isoform X2 [Anopheles aquasalis]
MSNYDAEIPKSLHNQLIFSEKLHLDRRTAVVYGVTKDLRLLELQQKNVNGSVYLGPTIPTTSVAFFEDTSLEMETAYGESPDREQRPRTIKIKQFCANDGTTRTRFILVQLDRTLVVVERNDPQRLIRGAGSESLVIHSRYESFRQLSFVDHPHRSGACAVRIELEQQHRGEPIVTDFLGGPVAAGAEPEAKLACFDEVLKMLQQHTAERKVQLRMVQLTVSQLFNDINQPLKIVPETLRCSDPEGTVPLVRYGEVWKRIHNDRLVIGVPLYNCTYERRLILKNLSLVMLSRDLKHLDYTSRFYQIKDDDFEFKSYDEFMEMEDTIERSLSFGMEWIAEKINVLHPEQTGVHVACFELSSLLRHGPNVCLDCYVTYNVATIGNECVELQLNVGPLTLPRTQLYSAALSIQLFSEGETYRDLLTITCTSEQLAIEITYKSDHIGVGLKDFFVGRLGFAEVLSSVEDRSLLYCGDNSYWQGTLIRLDRLIGQRMKAKLYCSSSTGHTSSIDLFGL